MFVYNYGHLRISLVSLVVWLPWFSVCERSLGFRRHRTARNVYRVVNTGYVIISPVKTRAKRRVWISSNRR